ncbi:porin [Sulfitobacter sp. S190]|uniref:porin n=1 Tax=Sulfitobacter sp. S190 TaxID=2867022 RepID=UPI0021A52B5A|nr:porin [Sulfitobacter sp. S190]UWR21972.1 porin [Sulfitobacter sp. S190]
MALTVRKLTYALPFAVLVPATAHAQDASPWDFYGQLNLGIINVDDGSDTETSFTDNDNSNSRFGLIFSQDLANGGQFRFHFETAVGFTGSSSITREDNDFDANYRRTELRKFEIIYDTPNIGRFSFGQGSIATDSVAEADLSGTSVIAYSSLQDQAGSQIFRGPDGSDSGVTVGNAFSAFDGGRRFRLRYDTPEYNGFVFSVSGGEEVLASGNDDEFYDAAITYNRDYGDYKVLGRVGYSIRDSDEELLLGSTAVLHEPTGLSLHVAAGRQQEGEANYVYVKGGYQRDWFAVGRTFLSVDYYRGDDFDTIGSESTSYGIAAVQKLDAYNVELYASYRTFEYEGGASAVDDIDVTFVGARWKF